MANYFGFQESEVEDEDEVEVEVEDEVEVEVELDIALITCIYDGKAIRLMLLAGFQLSINQGLAGMQDHALPQIQYHELIQSSNVRLHTEYIFNTEIALKITKFCRLHGDCSVCSSRLLAKT